MKRDIEIQGSFITVHSIGFWGNYTVSPNSAFIFCWNEGRSFSFVKGPPGQIVMLRDGEILWHRNLNRPTDAVVVDSGRSIVTDWPSMSAGESTFYVFGPEGEILVKQAFHANLMKTVITQDGELAWCMTAYSNDENDNNKLVVFSLSPTKLLLNVTRPSWQWEIVGLRLVDLTIEVITTVVPYKYDQSGILLNEWEITKAFLQHDGICDVLRIAEKLTNLCLPERMPQEEVACLIAALERVTNTDVGGSGYWRAKAQRMAGEISLACGEKNNALAHFRKALAFDPKVGVVKLVRKLERELRSA